MRYINLKLTYLLTTEMDKSQLKLILNKVQNEIQRSTAEVKHRNEKYNVRLEIETEIKTGSQPILTAASWKLSLMHKLSTNSMYFPHRRCIHTGPFHFLDSLSGKATCTHRPQAVIIMGFYMSSNIYYLLLLLFFFNY